MKTRITIVIGIVLFCLIVFSAYHSSQRKQQQLLESEKKRISVIIQEKVKVEPNGIIGLWEQ